VRVSILFAVLLVALLLAGGHFWNRRRGEAKTESSLVLEPEKDEARAVARALSRGFGRIGGIGGWGTPRLRSFDFVVESKNGTSALIAEAIAARLVALKMALSVRKSDMVTLKAVAAPVRAAGERAVIHHGRVLESTSTLHVSNHSLFPMTAARVVPRVLSAFPGSVRCRMVLHF